MLIFLHVDASYCLVFHDFTLTDSVKYFFRAGPKFMSCFLVYFFQKKDHGILWVAMKIIRNDW